MAKQKQDHEQRMFTASLKGVKMEPFDDPDNEGIVTAEEVKANAMRRRAEFLGIQSGEEEVDPDNEFGYSVE